jgi:hypothetical protein
MTETEKIECPVCGMKNIEKSKLKCPQCNSDLTCFTILDSLSTNNENIAKELPPQTVHKNYYNVAQSKSIIDTKVLFTVFFTILSAIIVYLFFLNIKVNEDLINTKKQLINKLDSQTVKLEKITAKFKTTTAKIADLEIKNIELKRDFEIRTIKLKLNAQQESNNNE